MVSLESKNLQARIGNTMAFSPGPLEIVILLAIFFILFGAERLPKMANALGRSKGEFNKGLSEATTAATIADLEACLLYTSPSPRDRQKSRMPSSA